MVVVGRNWNVESERVTRTWPDWWPTCRRGWSGLRSGLNPGNKTWFSMVVFLETSKILLLLLQPVTVVSDISDQSVYTDKEAVFECEIKINYPEITLSWYKGTQKLDTNDKYNISISGDRHLLKVKGCQASDQGNYRVVCGPHISSAKLTVMGQYRHRTAAADYRQKPAQLQDTQLEVWPSVADFTLLIMRPDLVSQ